MILIYVCMLVKYFFRIILFLFKHYDSESLDISSLKCIFYFLMWNYYIFSYLCFILTHTTDLVSLSFPSVCIAAA